MPTLMDTSSRAAEVADAVVFLIVTRGIEAVSIRNIAETVRIRPSTLTSHLTNKSRILHLTTVTMARRVGSGVISRGSQDGILAFLPDDEGLDLARAWLGMVELARGYPDAAAVVGATAGDRRNLLRYVVDHQPDDVEVDAVLATIDGLTAAMTAADNPLPIERARAALTRVCVALGWPTRSD